MLSENMSNFECLVEHGVQEKMYSFLTIGYFLGHLVYDARYDWLLKHYNQLKSTKLSQK